MPRGKGAYASLPLDGRFEQLDDVAILEDACGFSSAIRRAASRVSNLAADSPPRLTFFLPSERHLMPDAGHFQVHVALLRRMGRLS